MHRFTDRGDPAQYLRADHVLVRCPRCERRAVLTGSRVTCGSCGYGRPVGRPAGPGSVVHYRAAGRCGRCGRRLGLTRKTARGSAPATVPVTCQGCTAVTRLPVSSTWSDSVPSEPRYRGYALWLQTPCCAEVLWAFDESHLDLLERYVTATLREREPNRNGSLASRLPAWVKSAKNRGEVTRAIARLRDLLAEQ